MKAPEPVGVLGGTFDPVHQAHLALARTARDRLGLSRILWIPAGQPTHRALPHAAPVHRLAMLRAALADEPGFEIDTGEITSDAPSFTVPTLCRLRETLGPTQPLVLLLGADAFLGLPGWHRWRELFGLAHIAVATRPGFPLEGIDAPLADILAHRRLATADFLTPAGGILEFPLSAGTVSATETRALIARRAPRAQLLECLPAPVLDYIHQHALYTA